MKARRVDLSGATGRNDVIHRILRTRAGEALELARQLDERQTQGLHDFRIACKRLRYALERFEKIEPSFAPAAERLALMQDALGEAHDRDALIAILPSEMPRTQQRLQGDRDACVDRAAALWKDAARALAELGFPQE